MEQTKVTLKIYQPLLKAVNNQFRALFVKRDAFLNSVLRMESSCLEAELEGRRLSSKARKHISDSIKRLDTTTINVLVDKEVASRLNKVVKQGNLVRDAFANRVFLFLLSPRQLLKWLDLPEYSSSFEFDNYEDVPTSPLMAAQHIFSDPLWYLRVAMAERNETGLYLALLPGKFSAFSCYLDDAQIPGSPENLSLSLDLEKLQAELNFAFDVTSAEGAEENV
ncbi:MAG: hypothetical protein OEZ43_16220 [Gammaproteobacteria bacterium]|nr:hypothetical protein [Gammaproteobacteria bacterium]